MNLEIEHRRRSLRYTVRWASSMHGRPTDWAAVGNDYERTIRAYDVAERIAADERAAATDGPMLANLRGNLDRLRAELQAWRTIGADYGHDDPGDFGEWLDDELTYRRSA